jgi:hypothetical protein
MGAFEVHGAIHAKWALLGYEGFGYPMIDETGTPDGLGRFNHFRAFLRDGTTADASICWTQNTQAQEVHGAIHTQWASLGFETSFLGYPTTSEYANRDGGRRNDFQYGSIVWKAATGIQVLPQPFIVDAHSIIFGTGIAVGGYGRLTLYSDGTIHLEGHLHDSGFVSYDCLVVFTVKDADGRAYAASHSGRVHGTDEPGSRDLDWDDWTTNDDVRKNWPKIYAGGVGGYKVDVTSDVSPTKIWDEVEQAVGIVLAVVGIIFAGMQANQSSNPNYGQPSPYPPGGTPQPTQGINPTPAA